MIADSNVNVKWVVSGKDDSVTVNSARRADV